MNNQTNEGWEKRFDLLWGIAPDNSLKEKKGNEVKAFTRSLIQETEQRVVSEILSMKRVAIQEKEAISPMGIVSVTHDMEIPPATNSTIRNLVYIKVHDVVRYAEDKGISILTSLLQE